MVQRYMPQQRTAVMEFTPERTEALRDAYCEHLEKMGADPKLPDSFVFQGQEFVVVYARYLLEYLDEAHMKGGTGS